MSRIQFSTFVVIMLAIQFADAGFHSRSNYKDNNQSQNRNNYYMSQGDASKQKQVENTEPKKSETTVGKGSSLSAWGIIGIVLAVIMLSTGGYYAFVLHPYLCKRERNYDMIELTNVA